MLLNSLTPPTTDSRRTATAVLLAVIAAAALLRFGDLGRQSPWLDEITNWQLAAEWGFTPRRGAHWLTFWCQSAGLALWDSEWGLRLYSALFGTATVAAGTAWALWRGGVRAGACVGTLLAFSPFGIFYSQDANHYAPVMLAGVAAAILADVATARAWAAALALALALGAAKHFHPVASFLRIVPGAILLAWAWTRLPGEQNRRKRMALAAAGLAAMALLGRSGLQTLIGNWEAVQSRGRQFGLSLDFWSATLGAAFGALHYFRPVDGVIGGAGLLLAAAGWLGVRRDAPLAAAGAALVVALAVLPFCLISIGNYFHPRYFAAAVPVLLMGAGLAVAQARMRPAAAFAAAWALAFLGRSVWWEQDRFRGSFQPSREAMAWLRANTPADAIIVTRHPYSALGMNFLWRREEMGGREFRALSYLPRQAQPAIQQAEELAATGRPVYWMSLIESEERIAFGMGQWIDSRSDAVAHFPSGAPDAFVPLDWSITVRRVRPNAEAFDLEREPARASSLLGEGVLAERTTSGSALTMLPGMSALWNFRSGTEQPGLRVAISVPGQRPDPVRLAFFVGDGLPRLAEVPAGAETATVFLPGPIPAGDSSIEIAYCYAFPVRSLEQPPAKVEAITFGAAEPGALVAHEVGAAAGEAAGAAFERKGPPAALDEPVATLGPVAAPAGGTLAVLGVWPRGFGDGVLWSRVADEDGVFRAFHTWSDWSFGRHRAAIVLPPMREVTAAAFLWTRTGYRPRDPRAEFGPLRVYAIEETP